MHLTLSVFIVLFHSIFAIQRHYTEDLEFVYIEPVPVEYSVNE